jgi:arylsulfatase
MRWPGVIKPGQVINDIVSLQDMIPTFAAAAGEPDLVEKVKKSYKIGDKAYKVHLDGYNLMPFLKGDEKESPREGFLYWSDDGELLALRVRQWKTVFQEQRSSGGLSIWRDPFTPLRAPKIYNLRSDPFERGEEGFFYDKWMADRAFLLVPAQAIVAKWIESFKEFPPRAKAASFTVGQVVESFMPKS